MKIARSGSHLKLVLVPVLAIGASALSLSAPALGASVDTVHERPNQEEPPPMPPVELKPAIRYSGRTPIDLSNGIVWNNGTYGVPNPDYEVWAHSESVYPNVSERNYPYKLKASLVSGLSDSAVFVDNAIMNWEYSIAHPTEVTKPEVIEYAKSSAEKMKPLLATFQKTIKDVDGASESNWATAQDAARKALVDMRGAYADLHHNVSRTDHGSDYK